MCRTAIKSPGLYLLFSLFLSIGSVCAQETQEARQAEESEFGSKFFDQLRTIFGRFQESDLDRIMVAGPIGKNLIILLFSGEFLSLDFQD